MAEPGSGPPPPPSESSEESLRRTLNIVIIVTSVILFGGLSTFLWRSKEYRSKSCIGASVLAIAALLSLVGAIVLSISTLLDLFGDEDEPNALLLPGYTLSISPYILLMILLVSRIQGNSEGKPSKTEKPAGLLSAADTPLIDKVVMAPLFVPVP